MHEAINCYLSVVLNWWLPGAPVLCWEVAWYGVGLLRHHWLACLQPWIRYGVTPEILSVGVDVLWLDILCYLDQGWLPSIAHVIIRETKTVSCSFLYLLPGTQIATIASCVNIAFYHIYPIVGGCLKLLLLLAVLTLYRLRTNSEKVVHYTLFVVISFLVQNVQCAMPCRWILSPKE